MEADSTDGNQPNASQQKAGKRIDNRGRRSEADLRHLVDSVEHCLDNSSFLIDGPIAEEDAQFWEFVRTHHNETPAVKPLLTVTATFRAFWRIVDTQKTPSK